MSLIRALSNWLSPDFKSIDQLQAEAFVDALVVTLVTDHKVDDDERRELSAAVEQIAWHSSTPIDTYIEEAIERARSMADDFERVREAYEAIADRLGEQWLQEETYYLAARIAGADDNLEPNERECLQAMVEAFEIPTRRLERITRQLIEDMDM